MVMVEWIGEKRQCQFLSELENRIEAIFTMLNVFEVRWLLVLLIDNYFPFAV